MIALLCTIVQGVWAWDGSGTSTDPYKIKNSADWKQLADDVTDGNSYSGQYFEMTADVDAQGISVGSESKPFSGTLSGGMYTLTYNAGTISSSQKGNNAPFVLLNGATIKDLKITGGVYSKSMYAAGLSCFVDGTATTTITNCHVSTQLSSSYDLHESANFGGFIAQVRPSCIGGVTFKNCSFQGALTDFTANSACFVGYTPVAVSLEHCMVDPISVFQNQANTATFVRAADGVACTFKECYYTKSYGIEQGQCTFREVKMPKGCTAEIVSEAMLTFNGVDYYSSGTKVRLTVPEGTPFDHWVTSGKPVGCFISDPWTANGIHTLTDVRTQPQLSIATSMPEPYQSNRERNGINYRYLTDKDYLLFMSDSLRQARGYRFNNKGECFVYDVDGTMTYITVVWNCNPNSEVFQNFFRDGWFQDKDYEGCIIDNDLVSDGWEHTHLFAIAPRAFLNVKQLKRIVFKSDIDPTFRGNAVIPLEVIIQEQAFKDSGIEELVMMYRNEKTEQWEVLGPTSGVTVAANAFEGTSAQIAVDPSVYQSYLADKNWSAHSSRFSIYAAKVEDMSVNGAVYSYMRNTAGEALKNSTEGNAELMQTLRYWNADYQEFAANSLLTNSSENIWYTTVMGYDDSYLKSNDGVMRIYNDPGSYYNYKTIAIGRNAFKGSQELKAIEFWQTNGRSENSFTDLKLVIQNGAFANCPNLRELRMYYYTQDGDDHWTVLGPKDVIPGDNIFGTPAEGEDYDANTASFIHPDFKIYVAPELYNEFINDPNWSNYALYIHPSEYAPSNWDAIESDGLTYDYASKVAGGASTNQVVTQNLSWWNVPIKIYEAVTMYEFLKSLKDAASPIINAFKEYRKQAKFEGTIMSLVEKDQVKPWRDVADAIHNGDFKDLSEKVLAKGPNQCLSRNEYHCNELIKKNIILKNPRSGDLQWADDAYNLITTKKDIRELLEKGINHAANRDYTTAIKKGAQRLQPKWDALVKALKTGRSKATNVTADALLHTTPAIISQGYSAFRAMGSDMTEEEFQRGLVENIKANIHNVSYENNMIYTPDKKLIYHVYVDHINDIKRDSLTIYHDIGRAWNYRTVGIKKSAFQGNAHIQKIGFAENSVAGSDTYVPMQLAIPDSAFAGCTSLTRFNLIYKTRKGGYLGLGPENFILGGDSIFAGCDSTKLQIVIAEDRRQDFLDDEMWNKYKRFFVYEGTNENTEYTEYGVNYNYYYDNNTTQRVSKVSGHKIEHLTAISADNKFLDEHQGSMGLMNDIGSFNNYKLDLVKKKAFAGNDHLKTVSFWDLNGGDSYTTLDMTLGDSCFINCRNLKNIDLLYCVTDGTDHLETLKPSQVRAGKGMLDGSPDCIIKMLPQQQPWFEADTAWVKYKDRFRACIIQPGDDGIRKALRAFRYYTPCCDPYYWDGYIDLMRIAGTGFSALDNLFILHKNDIRSFAEFKQFESVGLDFVGKLWFSGLSNLSNILLPQTVKTIRYGAFDNCAGLREIELPAAVTSIEDYAFAECQALNTIKVNGAVPATLGEGVFTKNAGLRIYVPTASVDAYKTAWAEYRDYIVGDYAYKTNKVVTVTKPDELAEKLGLTVDYGFTGLKYAYEPRYVQGNYAKYDSLTIYGPLGNVDLAVIRYLAGCDAYGDGGKATDGRLRYLNLYNASIRETSDDYNYYSDPMMSGQRYCISEDNKLPAYLFQGCKALETVILPKSLKDMDGRIFGGCTGLKQLAVTSGLDDYDSKLYFDGLIDYPLETLVFTGDKPAQSNRKTPWGQTISNVYTKQSQLGDYLSQTYLTQNASSITAPLDDDAVVDALAENGYFFPDEYLQIERLGRLFTGNDKITRFEDFRQFYNVRELDNGAFQQCTNLRVIALPDSVKLIRRAAFNACSSLDTIYISTDSVPELETNAFMSLPHNFRILVPKNLCKIYRERWAEYANHINADDTYDKVLPIRTVIVNKPNTLATALGLEPTISSTWDVWTKYLHGLKGDYSDITRLKVVGPISATDFDVLRHLAGWCPWRQVRNYTGHLEYIDLYDAQIVEDSDYSLIAKGTVAGGPMTVGVDADVLPSGAFQNAYSLKTLILPRTCKKVRTRAMIGCEDMETLVIGDDMEDFNWSALDDGASLSRLYILAKKKPEISAEFAVWRWLCNNYNPTFDAFYVRPSMYKDYVSDANYTGSSWQRTNNISKGAFEDDESFCAFAAHAAATQDDLAGVTSVEGWFDSRPNVKDLTPLKYTAIDTLKAATMAPLTQLEQVALPKTLKDIEQNAFQKNTKLRYVDMLLSNDADLMNRLHNVVHSYLGLNEQMTLAYMPAEFGDIGETNVVVSKDGQLKAYEYSLIDSLDYMVPYAFEAISIKNSRKLAASQKPYSMCLPYAISLPQGSTAYKLSWRDANTLVFEEVTSTTLEALHPYLVMVNGDEEAQGEENYLSLDSYKFDAPQPIPASTGIRIIQDDAPGYSIRGTLKAISNAEAADLGAHILQSDGKWHPVSTANAKASILPFRAYLLPSTHSNGARAVSMSLVNADGTTAIDTIRTIDADGTERYYDLNGRRIDSRTAKGVVIENGKKVIRK